MIKLRLLAFGAVLLLTVSACGKTDNDATTSVAENSNSLLAYVPTNSPYLAANLQPIEDEVLDTFLTRAQPALTAVQQEISLGLEALEAEATNDVEDYDQMASKVAHAVLQELDGKLNRQGLESLGFDLQSHKVLYGMGVFPVLRVGLSDADVLRSTIERVLNNAEISATEMESQGTKYWRLAPEGTADQPAGVYIAILSDHLAISLFPPVAEDEMLPAFLGQTIPTDSDALARLQDLNARHGYTSFGSGILDFNLLFDEFVDPNSVIAQILNNAGGFDATNLAPECVSEVRDIISNTPRFTVGTTELTADAVGFQYRVETKSSLAQELVALVANIPLADPLSTKLMEFSFGMRLGALRDFLRNKMAAIEASPYQCEHLQDLNTSAEEAFASLNQPLPPLINNFRGIRASLSEISVEEDFAQGSKGVAAIHVEKPQMFVGMAQMFVPDLAEMTLEPGSAPVRLPETMIPMPGVVAFAALSDESIGISLGEGEQDALPAYLAQSAGSDGTFLSTNYNMAAYMEMTGNLGDRIDDMHDNLDPSDPEMHEYQQPFIRIGEAVQNVFKEISDRNHLTMQFTADGFVADSRMTFK